jgi:hypothetical protein
MRDWRRLTSVCLAAVISLAVTAPALAAPAGSEYVPKVPKAAGEEILRGKQGPGGTVLSPEVRGNGRTTNSAQTSSSGDDDVSRGAAAPGAADTLLDPVVLLLVAGVGAAALSMTLRQRRYVSEDPEADRMASDPDSAPATPDGEIVDREPHS